MMETAQIYINKLIGEQNFVCTYNGILCKHKRGEVPIHATINLKTYAKSKKPHQKVTHTVISLIRNIQGRLNA